MSVVKLYEPSAPGSAPAREWQAGSLLFFWGRGWTSWAIELATRGPSHVGMIIPETDGRWLLWESTTLCNVPDALNGRQLKGVQAHFPEDRVAAYDGRVAVCYLRHVWRLAPEETEILRKRLHGLHGKHYDAEGAIETELRVTRNMLFPYPDLGTLFCSEMCAALLQRLGRLPLANPSAYTPASLLRALRVCGIFGAPVFLQ